MRNSQKKLPNDVSTPNVTSPLPIKDETQIPQKLTPVEESTTVNASVALPVLDKAPSKREIQNELEISEQNR